LPSADLALADLALAILALAFFAIVSRPFGGTTRQMEFFILPHVSASFKLTDWL
jgi:hypothetical protein